MMKSRSQQLLSKSLAAMVASIEIYNKPDFKYREESVAVLMVNAWELLVKAKWLKDHNNRVGTLYVREPAKKQDGTNSKRQKVKMTRGGNPFTHSLDYLVSQLCNDGVVHANVGRNLSALTEIRDSAVHFYNRNPLFSRRLQEVCTASVRNYSDLVHVWFGEGLGNYNFYTMPLSFIESPNMTGTVLLNNEEQNLVTYINRLETEDSGGASDYVVSVNYSVHFNKSKEVTDALSVQVVHGDPEALKIQLTEEQVREQYPWTYGELTQRLRSRYTDFKVAMKYHDRRRVLLRDPKFGNTRYLDPSNPKSGRKPFFNPNIVAQFDDMYARADGPRVIRPGSEPDAVGVIRVD